MPMSQLAANLNTFAFGISLWIPVNILLALLYSIIHKDLSYGKPHLIGACLCTLIAVWCKLAALFN